MFDMYRVKKKRPVDPNAPPRPNLLNHEKRLKDTTGTVDQIQDRTHQLERRIDELERKLISQTQYLNALHQSITARSKNSG